ncbi:hypothetical protein AB5I39_14575 [Sphingomonas sp. MMS24-J45]|uniref:hypothetical protein n=1 Tax=Sphingomonas sp. MMS24-J45 TaxID=3238806 RepID=UPI00384B255C
MLRTALCALALISLAACDDGKEGSSFTLNSTDSTGNAAGASIDGKGEATIDTPFFKGKVTLPKLKLDADNFDMNGVHLYPGSKISGMNVDVQNKDGDKDDGRVRIAFTSPAAPATVRAWFKDKLTAAGFTLSDKGNGLTGTTDEDKPFTLELTPDGADKSSGVITVE